MLKPILATLAAATAFTAAPATAHDRYAGVFDDSNSHYLDYKTDISEARRELQNDLRGADNRADRMAAHAEFDREIADAEVDFRKEMAEQGIMIGRGRVTVEPEIAAIVRVPRR